MTLCECGCGEEVKPVKPRRFIKGHHVRGRIISEEHKQILRDYKTGRVSSIETRQCMSKAHEKRGPVSEETKRKQSIAALKAWTKRKAQVELKRKKKKRRSVDL